MMQGLGVVIAAAAGGGLTGWWLARWRAGVEKRAEVERRTRAEVGSHLLPDPALDWLRRAHGAIGVWVAQLDSDEGAPRAERIVDAERLTVAQIVSVDRRLERARDRDEGGTEQLDGGTLVFQATAGIAAGVLLPDEVTRVDAGDWSHVEDDLRRLLDGVRRKPQTIALAQARSREASVESTASIGLRLAYQIERMLAERRLGAEVVVAVAEIGGVRVVGVSGRGDRRLLDSILPTGSALARAARGEADGSGPLGDPFDDPRGGVTADRRQGSGAFLLLPMRAESQPVGAVALRFSNGETLGDSDRASDRAEVGEALRDAAARLGRTLEAGRERKGATVDAVTGLYNQRGFEELLARHESGGGGRQGTGSGALIYLELDEFDALLEVLGHAAADAAMVHVARLLRGQLRGGDHPAKLAGAQFAVWVAGADLALGVKVAERIRAKIEVARWDWRGRVWPLTASFGVAATAGPGQRQAELAAQVAAALSLAKVNGRNRVEKAG